MALFREEGGGGGRIIGGIIIAVIGFMMYMSQVQENPVTHERQHVAISPDQEIRLGLQSAPVMAKQMGGELPASDLRVEQVKTIGSHLVASTDAKKSPWKFQFHVLADTRTINAFALPGGQIFITAGLLDKLKTKDQIAGVLGHEMGHVIERHSAQQMATSQLGQLLVVAVGTAASSRQHPQQSYNAALIASLVNQMFQLRYSRADESAADIWGIKLLAQAGYDPKAMVEVLRILKESAGKNPGMEIFQTHPNPDLRIKEIEEYLRSHPA